MMQHHVKVIKHFHTFVTKIVEMYVCRIVLHKINIIFIYYEIVTMTIYNF